MTRREEPWREPRYYRADLFSRLLGSDPRPPEPPRAPDPFLAAVVLPASRWSRPGREPITLDDVARWPDRPAWREPEEESTTSRYTDDLPF